jgi:hypothetical protein
MFLFKNRHKHFLFGGTIFAFLDPDPNWYPDPLTQWNPDPKH